MKEKLAKVLHRKKVCSHIGHFLILDFKKFTQDIYTSKYLIPEVEHDVVCLANVVL